MTTAPPQRESFWLYFARAADQIPTSLLGAVIVLEVVAIYLLESSP